MTDLNGFVVDATGDGGDSANFTCTKIWLGGYQQKPELAQNLIELLWNQGQPVRHPHQVPWNNPKNFSRDQAIPLIAVLDPEKVRAFYKQHRFFLPNRERDVRGSQKYPYPHRFFNDQGQKEWRIFDYADPVTPDFLGLMIVKGRMKELEWFLPIARVYCRRSVAAHCKLAVDPTYNDFKQLYITAKYLNVHKDFLRKHPRGLCEASKLYFSRWRGLDDLHELFLKEFEREIKNPSG